LLLINFYPYDVQFCNSLYWTIPEFNLTQTLRFGFPQRC
jgi:hypothetical protein